MSTSPRRWSAARRLHSGLVVSDRGAGEIAGRSGKASMSESSSTSASPTAEIPSSAGPRRCNPDHRALARMFECPIGTRTAAPRRTLPHRGHPVLQFPRDAPAASMPGRQRHGAASSRTESANIPAVAVAARALAEPPPPAG
jgi:hypothetical protein